MQNRDLSQLSFVPPEGDGREREAAERLQKFFQDCGNQGVVVITGAGVSTESGIPDYRSPNGSYSKGHKPIQHDEFLFSESHRKRYWARSMQGWKPFSLAQPNQAHHSIAALEQHGAISAVITQNVDALHQKAGSQRVVDLHGRSDLVRCLSCPHTMPRAAFHKHLLQPLNPSWSPSPSPSPSTLERSLPVLRPDGDAEVDADFSAFTVPGCPMCGSGVMKPDVVFFGDVVPPARKAQALDLVLAASGLLVAGSTLSTLSAFRLVDAAVQHSTPVAILNIGPTRAETNSLPHLKVATSVTDTEWLRQGHSASNLMMGPMGCLVVVTANQLHQCTAYPGLRH